MQYLFQISQQSVSHIIPEVCQAIFEALKEGKHEDKKNVYFYTAKCFVHKIDVLEHSNENM